MAQIRTFRDLKAWQKTHELALEVYKITTDFPLEEKFGLVSQMRRAAVSTASNIVEGLRRKHPKDSLNFYNIEYSGKFFRRIKISNIFKLRAEINK